MPSKVRKLTVSLDAYTFDLLAALALQADRSLSYVVGLALQHEAVGGGLGSELGAGLDPETHQALRRKHGVRSLEESLKSVVTGGA
jgi:hypothetical protein